MPIRIYKLNFTRPVHFGKKRLSDSNNTILADTLFSAIFIEALNMGINTEKLLNNLTISDTFPFIDDTLYLPKPMIDITGKKDDDNYKIFKKLQYIPINLFESYLNGEIDSTLASNVVEDFVLGENITTSKVNISKTTEDKYSEPYTVGLFQFYPYSGLYFIAEADDETQNILEQILYSLEESGLGGKRSSGYGQFIVTPDNNLELTQIINKQTSKFILLSSSMALEEELELILENARFNLIKRSGFVQSVNYQEQLVKKKDFYSFSAGSVFRHKFTGDIFDVSENGNHPVYRYAKPLWIGGYE